MSESVICALISGGLTLIGAIISNRITADRMQHEMKTQMAVMETKLSELTREVREHNNFARRMPVVEEQIKVANHRIEDLERR